MTLSRLSPSIRRALRLTPLALALMAASAVRAQSLAELYDAARGYDATYLGIKAQAESARYRAEQTYALRRPGVSLDVGSTRSNSDTPYLSTLSSHQTDTRATLTARPQTKFGNVFGELTNWHTFASGMKLGPSDSISVQREGLATSRLEFRIFGERWRCSSGCQNPQDKPDPYHDPHNRPS